MTNHSTATAFFENALRGEYGFAYTSEYVVDETVTLVRARTGSHREARTVRDRVLGRESFPSLTTLLFVGEAHFHRTIDVYDRYADHSLSFTDASTIALVDEHDIDYVASFDDDFDGIVDRLDPVSV